MMLREIRLTSVMGLLFACTVFATAVVPAPASGAAKGVERFAKCKAPEPISKEDIDGDPAVEYFVGEYGGSRKAAARWLQVQATSDDIRSRMRASPARKDFMNMSFDNERKRVNIYVRNHSHDRAIRRCARELGIAKFLHIGLRKWSSGDLLRALRKVEDAVPDLYDAGLFECSYGAQDYFTCEVYRTATDEQFAAIETAAKATKVGYRVVRLDEDPPVPSLL